MKNTSCIILVIEDNDDHAEIIKRTLQCHSKTSKIIHINEGEKALDYLFGNNIFSDRDTFPLPNIVLLDLRLPKVDGLNILKKIKQDKLLMQTPVIILTSSHNEKDIETAYKNYVNSYLVKPLKFNELIDLIEMIDTYWLCYNNIS